MHIYYVICTYSLFFIKMYNAEKITNTTFKFNARFPRIKLTGNRPNRQLTKKVLSRKFTILNYSKLIKNLKRELIKYPIIRNDENKT